MRKVTEEIEYFITAAGGWGFSAVTIQDWILKETRIKLCIGTIQKYLSINGVSLKAYRNGNTSGAQARLITASKYLTAKRRQHNHIRT